MGPRGPDSSLRAVRRPVRHPGQDFAYWAWGQSRCSADGVAVYPEPPRKPAHIVRLTVAEVDAVTVWCAGAVAWWRAWPCRMHTVDAATEPAWRPDRAWFSVKGASGLRPAPHQHARSRADPRRRASRR